MSGYSNTPLTQKLGLKEEMTMVVLNAPLLFLESLDLPLNVSIIKTLQLHTDYIHLFTKSRKELADTLPVLKTHLKSDGVIWVSWPKKASKVPTDITEDVVRAICLPLDLVDVKVVAIDDIWSGLKLVIRKEKRNQKETSDK